LCDSQVQFANQEDIPFLAFGGAHGAITTLGKMDRGIEIYLNQLSSIEVASDGQTATFGGGVMAKNVTDALWAAGKQTGKSERPDASH
jgi:FAD/FMN-containing dehydrogenase